MKIVAISDLHGQLPRPVDLPVGDVLVIAGDVCPDFGRTISDLSGPGMLRQADWLDTEFRAWLESVEPDFDAIIGIAGNHDFVFERKDLVPRGLHWIYLEDSGCNIGGIEFWGTPWVPNLPRWAFHASNTGLNVRAEAIPETTDVLISHGPPYGYLDAVGQFSKRGNAERMRVGEQALRDHLGRIRPVILICGHIHEENGSCGAIEAPTAIFNVSLLDDNYRMVYEPTIITL